jgi:hypothetical protein
MPKASDACIVVPHRTLERAPGLILLFRQCPRRHRGFGRAATGEHGFEWHARFAFSSADCKAAASHTRRGIVNSAMRRAVSIRLRPSSLALPDAHAFSCDSVAISSCCAGVRDPPVQRILRRRRVGANH